MFLRTGKRKLEFLQIPKFFDQTKPIVLAISNAYGILLYTKEFIKALYEESQYNIFAFNLSGQGNSEGIASLKNYVDDMDEIFNFMVDKYGASKQNFYLYINCSGIFSVLELAKVRKLNFIKKIIIYNYLHTPSRLYLRALKKMDRYNVRHVKNPISRNYDVIEGFKHIKCPIIIIHP